MNTPPISINTPNVNVGGVDLTTLLQQNLSTASQEAMTPEIKATLASGLQFANDLSPAYGLMAKTMAGGQINPQEAVAALAGVATLVNPLAGAAVMAAGEIAIGFETLLKDLGLVSDAPKPVPYVGLIPKTDANGNISPIPSGGPGSLHPDPNWLEWKDFAFSFWPQPGTYAALGGVQYAWKPGILVPSGSPQPVASPAANAMVGVITAIDKKGDPKTTVNPKSLKSYSILTRSSFWPPFWPPNAIGTAVHNVVPKPANAFEAFLMPMMQKDAENWANGSPYVDPRHLVTAAISAWNGKHAPSAQDIVYQPAEDTDHGFIPFLLGSHGDSTGNGQVYGASPSINMGPALAAPVPVRQVSLHLGHALPVLAPTATVPPPSAAKIAAATWVAPSSPIEEALPYLPAAAGALLTPVAGLLAPVVGVAATAVWLFKKSRQGPWG